MTNDSPTPARDPIAIVGMACALGGAASLADWWRRVVAGTPLPADSTPSQDPAPDLPDALLRAVLADAGLAADARILARTDTALLSGPETAMSACGGVRLRTEAGLLAALHEGCRRLARGDSDALLAAGTDTARGAAGAAGAAMLLMPLAAAATDGHPVYAILESVGTGSGWVPARAGVGPETIGYLETDAFDTNAPTADLLAFFPASGAARPCPIGALAPGMGDTGPVIGLLALIKTVLCVHTKIVPPSRAGPALPATRLAGTRLYTTRHARPWICHPDDGPRRAALILGLAAGREAHAVLREALPDEPARQHPIRTGLAQDSELVVFGAADRETLREQIAGFSEALGRAGHEPPLRDVAFSACTSFDADGPVRLAAVCRDLAELRRQLEMCEVRLASERPDFRDMQNIYFNEHAREPPGRIAWIFPGMGFPGLLGSYPDRLIELCLHFPEVRATFDRFAFPASERWRFGVEEVFLPPPYLSAPERSERRAELATPRMERDTPGLPNRFMAAFGIAAAHWLSHVVLRGLGIPADMMFGQSFGDISALCAAGVMDFEELLPKYWAAEEVPIENVADVGRLAAVAATEERIAPVLAEYEEVIISLHIARETQIVAGPLPQLEALLARLSDLNIWTQLLPFAAIHTPRFSVLRPALGPLLRKARLRPGKVPVYSAVTQAVYPETTDGIERVMLDNLDHPVQMWRTTRKMYEDGARVFVQAGGGAMTHHYARSACEGEDVVAASLDTDHRGALDQVHHMCAALLTNGVRVDLDYLFRHRAAQRLPLPATASEAASFSLPTQPTVASAEARGFGENGSAGNAMPFLGTVTHYVPDREIDVEHMLDLSRERHLHDHLFVHAPGVKPASACLPVMPMTMSMEMLAEVAACLAPGTGLIGFEDVRASRWIALRDRETLPVRIEARFLSRTEPAQEVRIQAEAFTPEQTAPVIRGTVVFAPRYLQTLDLEFRDLANPRPYPIPDDELYGERYLFHGPAYQSVRHAVTLGDEALVAELSVLPRDRLFAGLSEPQLLSDPLTLDGIGQIVGLWAHEQEEGWHIFPIGAKKVEFYCPPPPVGTRITVCVQVLRAGARTMYSDIEACTESGDVWLRVREWGDWIFHWQRPVKDFHRVPTKHAATHAVAVPGAGDRIVCRRIRDRDLRDFDLDTIARFALDAEEMRRFIAMQAPEERRRQWLLGRIAAKDAVRLWLKTRDAAPGLLHPASLRIESDADGRPSLAGQRPDPMPPCISIAHCRDCVVAAAGPAAIGLDIEAIVPREAAVLNAFLTAQEHRWLQDVPAAQRDAWHTRLWCAKEAAGKALGKGLAGAPQRLVARESPADGQITILHEPTGRQFDVRTWQEEDMAFAFAQQAEGSARPAPGPMPDAGC